jgi:hypothetical protein
MGLTGLLFLTGCQSSKPGGSSHASVEIKGHSIENIRSTAVVVFAEEGYALRTNLPAMMIFSRPATSAQKFKYGDWMNDGMVMEIKLRVQEMAERDVLLRADVYAVQDASDPYFRNEQRVMTVSRRSYQKMLDEVQHRVEAQPAN